MDSEDEYWSEEEQARTDFQEHATVTPEYKKLPFSFQTRRKTTPFNFPLISLRYSWNQIKYLCRPSSLLPTDTFALWYDTIHMGILGSGGRESSSCLSSKDYFQIEGCLDRWW